MRERSLLNVALMILREEGNEDDKAELEAQGFTTV
jgi:hypothetical protein